MEHSELLDQYGVRLNIIGRTEMLPEDVQEAVDVAEDMTRKNNRCAFPRVLNHCMSLNLYRATLNICMPYASRDEMTRAVEKTVKQATEKVSSVE